MTKEIMNRCEIYKDFDLKTKQMFSDRSRIGILDAGRICNG